MTVCAVLMRLRVICCDSRLVADNWTGDVYKRQVLAMANPTPEIMPDDAKAGGVRVMATGRSDFPNQVNNVLCFPGLFKGALSVRARDINNEMKLAAAYAIADLITDADRSEENIIPGAFDPRVAEAVANAVAKAARETGVARL